MNNIRGMIIALTVFLLAAPGVYAREDYSADDLSAKAALWKQKRKEKRQEIFNQLNLTEEQKRRLKENKTKHREQRKDGFEKIKSYKEAIKQELLKPDLDMRRIQKIQEQMKALQAQMADDRLNSILEVRTLLTPEQFAKFMTLMEQHRKKGSRFRNEQNDKVAPVTESAGE